MKLSIILILSLSFFHAFGQEKEVSLNYNSISIGYSQFQKGYFQIGLSRTIHHGYGLRSIYSLSADYNPFHQITGTTFQYECNYLVFNIGGLTSYASRGNQSSLSIKPSIGINFIWFGFYYNYGIYIIDTFSGVNNAHTFLVKLNIPLQKSFYN